MKDVLKINPSAKVIRTNQYVSCLFERPYRVLSSAVLNGGFQLASQVLNLKVASHATHSDSPQLSLQNFADVRGWQGNTVGLMTSASMKTFRLAQRRIANIELACWVTSGLSNLRRIGDHADYRKVDSVPEKVGTINLGLISSIKLNDAAMAEVLMMLTEAKVAAISDAKLTSPISNQQATGTGTDSVVVASVNEGESIEYCGKHVLIGEVIGQLAYQAISSSFVSGDGEKFAQPMNQHDFQLESK